MAYIKPGWFLRSSNRLMDRLRLKPVLLVRRRKSGGTQRVPVNVLEHDGSRYLVAPRGETQWAKNLRAAGGDAELSSRKGVDPITTTEVPDEAKPSLIEAYREHWETETKRYWKHLPDPADHPIFEIHSR